MYCPRWRKRCQADCFRTLKRQFVLRNRGEATSVFDPVMRFDRNVKDERMMAERADLDAVDAGWQVEMLEVTVEIIDDTGVVAVDVHFTRPRFDVQSNGTSRTTAVKRICGPDV